MDGRDIDGVYVPADLRSEGAVGYYVHGMKGLQGELDDANKSPLGYRQFDAGYWENRRGQIYEDARSIDAAAELRNLADTI